MCNITFWTTCSSNGEIYEMNFYKKCTNVRLITCCCIDPKDWTFKKYNACDAFKLFMLLFLTQKPFRHQL